MPIDNIVLLKLDNHAPTIRFSPAFRSGIIWAPTKLAENAVLKYLSGYGGRYSICSCVRQVPFSHS
jgi:hypothetical protein